MFKKVTKEGFINDFKAQRPENFSHEALNLIYDYMEDYMDGEDYELDVVGICCEISEESAEDIARSCKFEIPQDDDIKDAVLAELERKTIVIGRTDVGIVYYSF